MNVEQLGVEDLQPLFVWGVTLGKEISDDLADKKLSVQEGIGLLDNFMQVPNLLEKKDAIIEQAKDLSLDEVNQIVSSVEGNFTKEEVVETIHDALNWIVATKNMIERIAHRNAA
jgi:hypothetical protein